MVKWNEPYQKLASCDSKGVIYVWIKYEGRWSIELINDRGTAVSDFAWSHDGRMIVICYEDGFVLVGSVNGQRYWSHMFDMSVATRISACSWTPNDSYVILGLSNGSIMVIDEHGTYLSRFALHSDSVSQIAYNCPKFFMDEDHNAILKLQNSNKQKEIRNNDYNLSISFRNCGLVHFMHTYDDLDACVVNTGMSDIKIEWSNCGEILAVGGSVLDCGEARSQLKFYSKNGIQLFSINIPTTGMLSALTWGHNDERIFVSTQNTLHVLCVYKELPSCYHLTKIFIKSQVKEACEVDALQLPKSLKDDIKSLFFCTIKSLFPRSNELKEFVCKSSPTMERLHCTMKCNEEGNSNEDYYTLYLEYLGALIPMLKARKTSKLKPDFVIYDPDYSINMQTTVPVSKNDYSSNETEKMSSGYSSESDAESVAHYDSICGSPKAQLRNLHKKASPTPSYRDNKLNEHKLVEINSNIWGTKFKFNGLNGLPPLIGSITYKTSLLHLQPRQMTISIKDLAAMKVDTTKDRINNVHIRTQVSVIKRDEEDDSVGYCGADYEDNQEDEETNAVSNRLVVYPSKAKKSSISNLSYNSMANEMISSNIGSQQQLQSRATSPSANLIRPISPPAMQIKDPPIASPRVPKSTTRASSILSIQSDSVNNNNNNNNISNNNNNSSIIEAVVNNDEDDERARRNLESLISCLDPTTSEPINRVLLFTSSKTKRVSSNSMKEKSNAKNVSSGTEIRRDSNLKSSMSNPSINQLPISINIDSINSSSMQNNDEKINASRTTMRKDLSKLTKSLSFRKSIKSAKKSKIGSSRVMCSQSAQSSNVMEYVMHNKPPLWNEANQVYQLDFGGRVTQESAKNFQIDFNGKQVMQFGRIEENAYTLDFDWPFTAIQAFSIALANITQRLK